MESEIIREETKKASSFLSWGTTSEKHFIQKLGTYREFHSNNCTSAEHLHLLRRYAGAMKHRVEWGMIDKDEIEKFVTRRIGYLAKRG